MAEAGDPYSLDPVNGGRARALSRLSTLRVFAISALIVAFLLELIARYLSDVMGASHLVSEQISLLALIVLAGSGLYLVASLRDIPIVKWSMVLASFLLLLSQLLNIAGEFTVFDSWPLVGKHRILGGSAPGIILIGGLIVMLATLYFALVEMVAIQHRLLRERKELSQEVAVRKRAEAALADSREQIRRLSAHLELAREEERASIAREIHDELGQTVTGLRFNLAHLEREIAMDGFSSRAPGMLHEVSAMKELLSQTMQSIRRIITELRPGVLDDLGLQAAVEWQAQEFQKRVGVECVLNLSVEDVSPGRDKSVALLRIFQEALTNVARHAQATKVTVTLTADDGAICLDVRDNGRGIEDVDAAERTSFGLLGIRERALQFLGEFRVESAPGRGTRIVVKLPLADEAPSAQDKGLQVNAG